MHLTTPTVNQSTTSTSPQIKRTTILIVPETGPIDGWINRYLIPTSFILECQKGCDLASIQSKPVSTQRVGAGIYDHLVPDVSSRDEKMICMIATEKSSKVSLST